MSFDFFHRFDILPSASGLPGAHLHFAARNGLGSR